MNKILLAFSLIIATSFATFQDTNLATSTTGIAYFVGSATNDKIGSSVTNIGKFNNDDYIDYAVASSILKVYVILGQSTARNALLDLSGGSIAVTNVVPITLNTGDSTTADPAVVAYAGDVNNDGKDDLLIGVPAKDSGKGGAYLIYGKSTTIAAGGIDLTAALVAGDSVLITDAGATAGDKYGSAVATAGNFDGDVYDDFLISSAVVDKTVFLIRGKGVNTGAAASTSNRPGTAIALADVTTVTATIEGYFFKDAQVSALPLGESVAYAGDVNGDGHDDFIIGSSSNAAWVVYGVSTTGSYVAPDLGDSTAANVAKFWKISGPSGIGFGMNVGTAGNFNADTTNCDDVFIGASSYSTSTGRVFVLFGSQIADIADVTITTTPTAAQGIVITGAATNDLLGQNSDGGIDLNKDGVDDLIIGAPGNAAAKFGKVYVIYGKSGISSIDLSTTTLAPKTTGFTITGAVAADGFGKAVSVVGDVNADGVGDFVVGAPNVDATAARTATGAVYEFHGQKIDADSGSASRLQAGLLVLASLFIALIL